MSSSTRPGAYQQWHRDCYLLTFAHTLPDPTKYACRTYIAPPGHRITPEEWMTAIEFLTRAGQTTTPFRQEFAQISSVLGVISLIDALHNPPVGTETESSNLGPFFTEDAPDGASRFFFANGPSPCAEPPPYGLQSRSASRSRLRGRASICTLRDTCATPAARLSLARSSRRGRRTIRVSETQVPFRYFLIDAIGAMFISPKASTMSSMRIASSQTAVVGS